MACGALYSMSFSLHLCSRRGELPIQRIIVKTMPVSAIAAAGMNAQNFSTAETLAASSRKLRDPWAMAGCPVTVSRNRFSRQSANTATAAEIWPTRTIFIAMGVCATKRAT